MFVLTVLYEATQRSRILNLTAATKYDIENERGTLKNLYVFFD